MHHLKSIFRTVCAHRHEASFSAPKKEPARAGFPNTMEKPNKPVAAEELRPLVVADCPTGTRWLRHTEHGASEMIWKASEAWEHSRNLASIRAYTFSWVSTILVNIIFDRRARCAKSSSSLRRL
jgi:hypothetical protein